MIGGSVKNYCCKIVIQRTEPRIGTTSGSGIYFDLSQKWNARVDNFVLVSLPCEKRVTGTGYTPSNQPYRLGCLFCTIVLVTGMGAALRDTHRGVYPGRAPLSSGQEVSSNPILPLNDRRQPQIILWYSWGGAAILQLNSHAIAMALAPCYCQAIGVRHHGSADPMA